jgi:hypothetical protein
MKQKLRRIRLDTLIKVKKKKVCKLWEVEFLEVVEYP